MMKEIKLYTKKIELKFDSNGVSITEVDKITEEILKQFDLIDTIPVVAIHENFQYITFKVTDKKDSHSIGFNFGKPSISNG